MIIIPAIDIRGGKCVRLKEGKFTEETVYAADPSLVAERYSWQGAQYLHVVDLDGALAGESRNLEVIKNILAHASMPVELGGGIRTLSQVDKLLSLGIKRVILGSVAVKRPEVVKEAAKYFPGQVVVGIDALGGMVAVEGWCKSGNIKALDLARAMAQCGITHIIFTDIARDGMLSGVNVEETALLAKESGLKVIASGGVSSLEDIRALASKKQAGIEGVIIGKALYTGAVDLREAMAVAQEA